MLAVIHILLEFILLSYEAKACKTKLFNYCIACLNGKFAWVPFTQDLEDRHASLILDFDDIRYSNRFVDCRLPFSFSKAGVSTLSLRVSELPEAMNPQFTIKVGVSIKDLLIEDFQQMIVSCGPKTDL